MPTIKHRIWMFTRSVKQWLSKQPWQLVRLTELQQLRSQVSTLEATVQRQKQEYKEAVAVIVPFMKKATTLSVHDDYALDRKVFTIALTAEFMCLLRTPAPYHLRAEVAHCLSKAIFDRMTSGSDATSTHFHVREPRHYR